MTADPRPAQSRWKFRPPWWAVALAILGCAAGIALGNWQMGRAQEKRDAAAALRPVSLRGGFLPQFTVYLDNKLLHGRPGFHVLQPLQTPEGRRVLVVRGWLAAGPDGRSLPPLRTPAGEVSIEGMRLERLPHALEPGSPRRTGNVWQNATVAEFAAWSGLALEPWILEQHSALEDGLLRDWAPSGSGPEKNESYALQWYSLAALSVILLFGLNLKRERLPA